MWSLVNFILIAGLVVVWSWFCVRVGVAAAAASVNQMIREGKVVMARV